MGKYQAMVTTSGQGIKKVKKSHRFIKKTEQKLSTCIYLLTTTRFLERNEINATEFEKMPIRFRIDVFAALAVVDAKVP